MPLRKTLPADIEQIIATGGIEAVARGRTLRGRSVPAGLRLRVAAHAFPGLRGDHGPPAGAGRGYQLA